MEELHGELGLTGQGLPESPPRLQVQELHPDPRVPSDLGRRGWYSESPGPKGLKGKSISTEPVCII